jgi:hypothetical protein
LTALLGNKTIYHWWNTDSKLIDIGSSKRCKNISLVVDHAILIRYYWWEI